jgi:CubicO group peptidase (beta-lactamase class C family)
MSIHRLTAVMVAAVLLTSCLLEERKSRTDMVEDIMQDYADTTGPGASVLVMVGDSIVFARGYGLADIERREPVTTHTNFRLASVTKPFTAMTILMLAEAGRLGLDDPLERYFPDFPAYGRGIRIRHLLTHTSGLVDYEDLIPDTLRRQVLDPDCLELMHRTDSLYFPPGSAYRYSNTGYALLALITQQVSGQSFPSFLRDSIFTPLGMGTTVAREDAGPPVAHRAYGHSRTPKGWVKTDQSQTSAVLGDGGIYSNPTELATWVRALWDHRLIGKARQDSAWAKATLHDGRAIDYGFGWHLDGGYPHHDGSSKGFRNHVLVFPEKRMFVAVLTNRDEGRPRELADRIARLF